MPRTLPGDSRSDSFDDDPGAVRSMVLGTTERRPRRKDRGVALVEFGFVALLLFTLLFGVIEYGYTFLQYLDVRHGAREVGRLAAVDYPGGTSSGASQTTTIITEACARLDVKTGVRITLSLIDGPDGNTTTSDVGDTVLVQVQRTPLPLTGFFPAVGTLSSTVRMRAEQPISWTPNSGGTVCT